KSPIWAALAPGDSAVAGRMVSPRASSRGRSLSAIRWGSPLGGAEHPDKNNSEPTNEPPNRRVAILKASLRSIAVPVDVPLFLFPQFVGSVHFGLKGKHHLLPRSGGSVGGEDHFKDGLSVLPGHQGLPIVLDTVHKVLKLLGKPIVPALLVHGVAPAQGVSGLFHGVSDP